METLRELLGNDRTRIYHLHTGESGRYYSHYSTYNTQDKEYYFSPMLSYGDYDNSCAVERSNYRVFLEEHKDSEFIKEVIGDYNSACVAVSLDCTDSEINEKLMRLFDYPCLNDEDVSMLELDMEQEYMDNFIEWDLRRLLKERYEDYNDHEVLDKDKFIELWHELKEKNRVEFRVESGGNGYIDTKRLFEGADFTDIIKIELYYQNESAEWVTEFI